MEIDFTLLERMKEEGILQEGHYAFGSGTHGSALIDRDLLLADPALASHFGYMIAKEFFTSHIETVITPSIWGAGLAQWVGYFLEPKAKVVDVTPVLQDFIIAEKVRPMIEGRRMLLVDNLILTGKTMIHLDKVVEDLSATVVGIASLWNSGPVSVNGSRVLALLNQQYPAWDPTECPMCAAGVPKLEQAPY